MRRLMLLLVLTLSFFSAAAFAQTTPPEKQYDRGEFKFTVAAPAAFVQVRTVPAAWDANAPGSKGERWRYWLHDEQIDRRPGQDIAYSDHVYEPVSPELVGEAGKFKIGFSPQFQQLTIHRAEIRRDGHWLNRLDPEAISLVRRESGFEQDLSDGQVTALIVLDDVRPGDLIRVSFSIKGVNPILGGNIEDSSHLAWIDPVLDHYFRVLYPRDAEINTHSGKGAPALTVTRLADALEASVHAHGIAGVQSEDDFPNWYDPLPMVQVAQKRSWADVAAWARPLYPDKPALPPELEARIATWAKIADPYRRAMTVLTAMQEEVRYFGIEMGASSHRPTAPAETWTRRWGDCKDKAYLTAVVLRRLGYEADPALVSTTTGRGIGDYTPAASVFNHVIVRVKIAQDTFWFDATATQQRGDPRQLDLFDYGLALPIAEGVTALEPVLAPKGVSNGKSIVERYIPSADGKTIDLRIDSEFHGRLADRMRRDIKSEGIAEVSRNYSDYYRKRHGALDVVEPAATVDDENANVLRMSEHYRLKEAWEDGDGASRVIEVYAEGLAAAAALPKSMSRTAPLSLSRPETISHEIRLELPPGWSSSGTDADVVEKNPSFQYLRQIKHVGQTVIVHHDMKVLSDYVPADQLDAYLRQMRKVSDSLGRRLYVQMPDALHKEDRDERLKSLLRGVIEQGSAK